MCQFFFQNRHSSIEDVTKHFGVFKVLEDDMIQNPTPIVL